MSSRTERETAETLAPGAEVELDLSDMAYGGDAVGRAGGNVVFTWGGITGERVRARVDRVKRELAWATVTGVETASPHRVAPPCPYFGPCGGCQWQHIDYAGQLDFKTEILREQLRRSGGLDAGQLDGLLRPAAGMDDPWQYRNVAHFRVDPASRQLGYFRRGSHSVVPVAVCPISDPGINALLVPLQQLFEEHSQAPGDLPPNLDELDVEAVRRGQMPISVRERKISGIPIWQVTVRTGAPPQGETPADAPWAGRQMVVVLHSLNGEAPPARTGRGRGEDETPRMAVALNRRALRKWIGGLGGLVSVVELRQDGSLELIGETQAAGAASAEDASELTVPGLVSGSRRAARDATDQPEAPPGVVRQSLGGVSYRLAPQAFFQVNNLQAEVILELIRAALPAPVALLVDAYSGAGAFGMALLAGVQAKRVVAIESDWAAVESARWTAALRGVGPPELEIEGGRVEYVLPRLDLSPDVVLLDPPRAGCAPALLQHLLKRPAQLLIYVSCDPSTLARDVRTLAPGYRLRSAQVVDMFPQTYHIETVAVLERIRADEGISEEVTE
ncbi:MAG: class I SAM-dependent RNA methyltransferase [Chloroflexia bacterium]